ncbi:MAG: AAA domain-containing protein [Thermoguttaceae bacterium]
MPWVEEHNAWDIIHKVYSDLFAIHHEQLRLGEEYELVLALGLLTWQTPTNQRVRRHLIVANIVLEFEARLGKFTIRPNPEGAILRPELDMLDPEDQPARAEERAKESLNNITDDPWKKDITEGVLKALVHSINPQGEYHDHLEIKHNTATPKPNVEYAPAIILRKRSTKCLTEILKRIKERIEKDGIIPAEFADLAEITKGQETEVVTDSGDSFSDFDDEIYFPKPSNEEQRRIVNKIKSANGILVQGPPGTGKSHTIANLVCHLLATGKRILITAKTPRALLVLEKLLPDELRPLCINLLGSGLEEKRSLESSVGGILRKNEEWNEQRSKADLQQLELKLRQLREEKAQIARRLRAIRESETHTQTIAEGAYHGTAARIALAINNDKEKFGWITDIIPIDQPCPINEGDLRIIINTIRKLTPELRKELDLNWPNKLPSPKEFADLVIKEREAANEEHLVEHEADMLNANHLSRLNDNSIRSLLVAISEFQGKYRSLLALPYKWMQAAVRDVVSNNPNLWRELHRVTLDVIYGIADSVSLADSTEIKIPVNVNENALFKDAQKLKLHLKYGGKLGWGPFRPRLVKERLYVVKSISLNGHLCASLQQIQILTDVLHVRIELENAWRFWVTYCERKWGPFSLQLQVLKSLCDALEGALTLEDLVKKCRNALEQCDGLPEPIWKDESQIQSLMGSCKLALSRINKRRATQEILQIESPITFAVSKKNAHPVARRVFEAIQNRDVDTFASFYDEIQELNKKRSSLQKVDEYLGKLRQRIPRLADDLIRTCGEICWDIRISHIRDAWHWAQAKIWLEEYIRKEDAPSLVIRERQIEDEIGSAIAKIASLRAWSFCFSRLREEHRRHMEAWQQSMRRLGKGTGKHAPRHRREAQKHLNECREAVPAWVMPLHRIWDTVDPAPGIFDFIIVDEASQCGFEGLPLLYLGKKILIVGDDKQISPDAVGLDRADVHRFMEEFLYDFSFKSSFDVESSLFDHGKLRYGMSRIALCEHFRCMPEIIRFSNDLCYSDTPLIPLRQYGTDRLSPLEHVPINNGYREGTGSRVVNRPEADAVVTKIAELCLDPRYKEKTMGVVVLQGDAQAKLIEDALLNQLGAEEIEKRRLICGNPYSFQGDERDIMFLSMVAAPNETIGPFTKPADERRFNVAASRARDQMWLFHSVTRDDLSTTCLRRRLLEFFEETKPQIIGGIDRTELERRAAQDNRAVVKSPKPFDSWFEVDVALELLRKGYFIIPQYVVANKRIDLVVEGGHARLAVECDGDEWHGIDKYEEDMQRQRMLERCGWEFFRVRECTFYLDRKKALCGLWRLLEERGIISSVSNGSTESKSPSVSAGDERACHKECHENEISSMKYGSESTEKPRKVEVGSTVIYVNEDEGDTELQALITYEKSNPEWGMMNVNTPISKALLGAEVGQVVIAQLPIGSVHLRVIDIKK